MGRRGSRNGGKGARSTIPKGRNGASGKEVSGKGTGGLVKYGSVKPQAKKTDSSVLGVPGKRGRKVTIPGVYTPSAEKSSPKKGKQRKGGAKVVIDDSKLRRSKAYKLDVLHRRSSNARKMSDDELKELSRITWRGRRARLKLVSEPLGIVEFKKVEKKEGPKTRSVRKQKFKVSEILKLYFENKSFREVFDDGHYVFVDGYFCIYSDECLEYKDNHIHIKEEVKSSIGKYCISLQQVFEIENGKKGRLISSVAHSAPKSGDAKNPVSMRYYIDHDGPDMYYTYGEALTHYMGEWEYDCDDMEDLTFISSKSFERYCANKHLPNLPYSVAICIALKLIPERSFEMIRLSENIIDFRTEIGRA